jgi:hypothetical protein
LGKPHSLQERGEKPLFKCQDFAASAREKGMMRSNSGWLMALVCVLCTVVAAWPPSLYALTGSAISTSDTLDSKPPLIVLTYPIGGELFIGATQETLRFSVTEDSWQAGSEAIVLSVLAGEDPLLSEGLVPQGVADYSYPWLVPDLTTSVARLVVTASDRFGWAATDTGGAFTIEHSLTGLPDSGLPARDGIATVFPNPFNPATTVQFALRKSTRIELAVFDLSGRRVITLASGVWPAGRHSLDWHGRDSRDRSIASGSYLLRLTVHGNERDSTHIHRMLLLK